MARLPRGIVTIHGVVHPPGAGAVRFATQGPWSLRVSLATWKDDAGVVHSTQLQLTRSVNDDELRVLQDRLQPFSVAAVRVRFSAENRAQLVELLPDSVPDEELAARAAELRAPVTVEHPRFGVLTLNRDVDTFEGRADWCGKEIRFVIGASADPELARAFEAAVTLWSDQTSWSERVARFAVDRLLALKNDNWLEEDEPEVDAAGFRARMTLETISVSPDGAVEFWHDDGDLFWGHSILVSGSLADGPTHADIPG